jgi:hypothetical protein
MVLFKNLILYKLSLLKLEAVKIGFFHTGFTNLKWLWFKM